MRNFRDYLRGVNYFLNWLFLEKPRGLDFSLRDHGVIENNQMHGYAMTSDKAFKNIAQFVDLKNKKFLDIGSGKGRVPYLAMLNGAAVSEGIEFSEKLHNIALKNYEILGCRDKVKSNCIDAAAFEDYPDFDVFFFFNPFEDLLYEKVVDRLVSQCLLIPKDRHVICYGGANLAALKKYNFISAVYEGVCPYRLNRIVIFKF